MIDNDERLLQQFFNEAAHQKIEDNGFTERVMQRIETEHQSSAVRSCISETSILCSSVGSSTIRPADYFYSFSLSLPYPIGS